MNPPTEGFDDHAASTEPVMHARRLNDGPHTPWRDPRTKWLHLIPPMLAITITSLILAINPRVRAKVIGLSDAEKKAQMLQQVEDLIAENYYRADVPEDLFDQAMQGMVDSLGDRYTTYFTPKMLEEFEQDTSGHFAGIGISLTAGDDGYPTVLTPFFGTPAYEAGLRPGDKFIEIDGKDPRGHDFRSVIVDRWLRGPEGSQVNLLVRSRTGAEKPVTLTRANVKIPSITVAKMLDDPRAKAAGVGFVRIDGFQRETAEDFLNAVNNLKNQGLKNLIVDIRFNRGGLLFSVRDIAGYFLPKQSLIVYTADGKGRRHDSYYAEDGNAGCFADLGLVVLADRTSASASEILAGALQDYQRAVIVGEITYGKGLVQNVFQIGDGNRAVKVTIARYFTPSGRVIQREHAYRFCPTCAERYLSSEDFLFCPRDGIALEDDPATHGQGYRGGIVPDILLELGDDEHELLSYAVRDLEVQGGPPVHEGRAKLLDEQPFTDRQLDAAIVIFAGQPVPQSAPSAHATPAENGAE